MDLSGFYLKRLIGFMFFEELKDRKMKNYRKQEYIS